MLFFFFFPSLLLVLVSCRKPLEMWLLASELLRLPEDDKVNGFRPFLLALEPWGCSLGRVEDEDEEEESSRGSSSRDWELPRNRDSSDVVEGVLWRHGRET